MTDPKDATVHDIEDQDLPSRTPAPGMLVTERVQLVRPLGSGGMADVWVADHLTLGIDVAVKFVREVDTPLMRKRLAQEARLAARIVHPHGVRIYDQGVTPDGTPFMVMERVEGEPLVRRLKRAGPLPLHEVILLVDQVAQVLTEAHGLGILHRDIKPHNIMLVADQQELFVKVLDFGLAKPTDPEEDLTLTAVGAVVGTPVYMAPEQLIDQAPSDERSDLWGLSVVAYEALTGQRPFVGPGRAALGAAIMLRKYERLSKLMIGAPKALEAWFERALAVDPEERFQTAAELAASFEEAATGSLVGSGQSDDEGGLHVSEQLYGREEELGVLRSAFDRAATGSLELVKVAGYAGIGKTALVRTFFSRLGSRPALFLGGKYDQFDRGTPYVALRQAFRRLAKFVGTLESDEVVAWRDRLSEHLGDLCCVVLEMMPELEHVLGPQPPLEELPPPQQRERFLRAITQLIVATATPEEPLVLFLDDLQWADLPSLELLSRLRAHPELRHTLIIGAYRDHEIVEGHPLATIDELQNDVTAIALGPLDEDAVLEFLSDTFGRLPGRVRLAVTCHEQTRGNPFFLRRLLEALHEEGILKYEGRAWTWDAEALQARPVTNNVVDFVANEIRRMPNASQRALAVAACVGDHFDLGLLAHALDTDRGQALHWLRDGLAAELILPSATGDWDQGTVALTLGARRIVFRFAHDRVRQAARSLIDDDAAADVHERIGRFMMESLGSGERDRRLFELVEHLNRGHHTDRPDALRELNLSAARRATRSAAFAPAADYYRRAHAHLAYDAWETSYEETLAIHIEGARAAYLDNDEERMNQLLDVAIAKAKTVLDRVAAREVRIQAMASAQRLQDAITLSFEVLRELGVELSRHPTPEDTGAAIGRVVARLEGREAAQLESLPMASDPEAAAVMRVAHGVLSSCYLAAPELVPIVTCLMVEATLDHGLGDTSGYGFAVLGLVLNATGATPLAYRTGALALALAERSEHRAAQPKTEHVVRTHINAFVEPVSATLEPERRIFQRAMDVGDLEFAGWALHISVAYGFYAGTPLEEMAGIARRNISLLRHHRQRPPLVCTAQYGQVVANLRGGAKDPTRLVGPDYDEDAFMSKMRAANVRGAAFILGLLGTFVRFLFGAPGAARERAEACAAYEDGALSTYHQIWFQQYLALAIAADGPDATGLAQAKGCLTRLEAWREASPVNLDHRISMVKAELARLEGRDGDALMLYDQAIAQAASHHFVIEEAVGNELAARFHLGRGARTPARAYAQEARSCFARWGATAKVEQLEGGLIVETS